MKKVLCLLLALLFVPCFFTAACKEDKKEGMWSGYACEEIPLPQTEKPLYIAGYRGGREISGVLDIPCVRALYLSYNGGSALMLSVDCVGLTSDTVAKIVKGLRSVQRAGCEINVCATHSHAGIDTMGLWGNAALEGKNPDYMQALVSAAIRAGKRAYDSQAEGSFTYGKIKTEGLLYDSRLPHVYDEYLYQLRFIPNEASVTGTRAVFFGAHAEALRGDNTLLSADFPRYLSDEIKRRSGENCIFFNGAIGGLIMTPELVQGDAVENVRKTGARIADYVMAVEESPITEGTLTQKRVSLSVPLHNTLYLYYKFLGILGNPIRKSLFTGAYALKTELSVLHIGTLTFALLPGEIFPELVQGGGIAQPGAPANPEPLLDIAKRYGAEDLIVIGLCNDEIGYIVPPADYVLHGEYPFLTEAVDASGRRHYEETNSVSSDCAYRIAEAFEKAMRA